MRADKEKEKRYHSGKRGNSEGFHPIHLAVSPNLFITSSFPSTASDPESVHFSINLTVVRDQR